MSMTRTIEIDGKQVPFKASAAIPRIYRVKYGRDIFKDLMKLEKALNENKAEESGLDLFSLETFENIAYLMAKHADPSLPDTAEGVEYLRILENTQKADSCGYKFLRIGNALLDCGYRSLFCEKRILVVQRR